MSFPTCPDCKNTAIPKQTGPKNEKNPSRWYFVCENCPGKDGKPGKFLSWQDGKNTPYDASKKRKAEETLVAPPPSPQIAGQNDKMDRILTEFVAMSRKIDQIHFALKQHCPALKEASAGLPHHSLNLYDSSLNSKTETQEDFE